VSNQGKEGVQVLTGIREGIRDLLGGLTGRLRRLEGRMGIIP